MLDFETIFTEENIVKQKGLDSGISLLDDLSNWISKFTAHLVDADVARNTLITYKALLVALNEYSIRYLSDRKGLSEFNDTLANDFLLWMENYKVNRDYGSIKERIALLFEFIKFSNGIGDTDFISSREAYYNSLESISKELEYSLNEFEDYYLENEISLDKISNDYIKYYIVNMNKSTATTMALKKAILQRFLQYIDDSLESGYFKETIKNLRVYKKAKGQIYKSQEIDEKSIKLLLEFIDNYTDNPKIFVRKLKKDSVYIAYRNSAMMLLMLGAGLRTSEALSLRYCDIIDSSDNAYTIHVLGGKGNKNRTSYIQKSLFKKHFEYLNNYKKSDTDFISLSSNGNKMARTNLYIEVKKVFIHLGIEKQGLHIFRHHFGSNFAATNGNMKILQDLLGHASSATTMIYSSTGEDAKEKAISGLGGTYE